MSVTTKTNSSEGCNNLVTNNEELATPMKHYFRGHEDLESSAVLLKKVTEVLEKSVWTDYLYGQIIFISSSLAYFVTVNIGDGALFQSAF